jgi:hypothetical protein
VIQTSCDFEPRTMIRVQRDDAPINHYFWCEHRGAQPTADEQFWCGDAFEKAKAYCCLPGA